MSGNGAVWGRVRSRLRAFPEHLAACGAEVRSCRLGQCLRDGKGPRGQGGDRRGAGSPQGDGRARGPPRSSPVPAPTGRGLRQVRAGVHCPRRPPDEGSVRAGVRGPAELLRRRGRWAPPRSSPFPTRRAGGPQACLPLPCVGRRRLRPPRTSGARAYRGRGTAAPARGCRCGARGESAWSSWGAVAVVSRGAPGASAPAVFASRAVSAARVCWARGCSPEARQRPRRTSLPRQPQGHAQVTLLGSPAPAAPEVAVVAPVGASLGWDSGRSAARPFCFRGVW